MRNGNEILKELGAAELAISEHATLFPDSTFEDGVIAALLWVIKSEGQTALMVAELAEFNESEVSHG